MNRYRTLLCTGLALCTVHAYGGISYEWDFADGLTDWSTTGNVTQLNDSALLSDAGAAHSTLFVLAEWDTPTMVIEMEFRDLLSDTIDPGRFTDAFFASVYFVDDPATFDLAAMSYDHALPLFTVGAGQDIILHTGTISPGGQGQDWLRYRAVLPSDYAYVIPVFELLDYNLTGGDSFVQIDRALIIPEPATFLLLGLGLVIAALAHRRSGPGSRLA